MSYAGLLSMLYADLEKDDPRVAAVTDWLNSNFTVKENPGLGQQGLYYYFNVMAKALTAANIDTLTTEDGKKIDWRKELSQTILSAQREDGSWFNKNSRWWENQPELVTCYAVLTPRSVARMSRCFVLFFFWLGRHFRSTRHPRHLSLIPI